LAWTAGPLAGEDDRRRVAGGGVGADERGHRATITRYVGPLPSYFTAALVPARLPSRGWCGRSRPPGPSSQGAPVPARRRPGERAERAESTGGGHLARWRAVSRPRGRS
jgi:hypothetical protein